MRPTPVLLDDAAPPPTPVILSQGVAVAGGLGPAEAPPLGAASGGVKLPGS